MKYINIAIKLAAVNLNYLINTLNLPYSEAVYTALFDKFDASYL